MRKLLKNARIYDGTGSEPYVSDILVEDDRIAKIAANIEDQEGLFTSLEAIHDYFCSLRMERFVLSPRNESQNNLEMEEVEIALNDLPRTEKSIVNSELKQAEPETVSLDGSNTVEPIGPVSFHQSRVMPVVQEKPLIGDESPEWPPKWND